MLRQKKEAGGEVHLLAVHEQLQAAAGGRLSDRRWHVGLAQRIGRLVVPDA